jgi:hypothetical protein
MDTVVEEKPLAFATSRMVAVGPLFLARVTMGRSTGRLTFDSFAPFYPHLQVSVRWRTLQQSDTSVKNAHLGSFRRDLYLAVPRTARSKREVVGRALQEFDHLVRFFNPSATIGPQADRARFLVDFCRLQSSLPVSTIPLHASSEGELS